MDVLRAHDYPELTTRPAVPDLKAFRRIIVGFIFSICACMSVVIMMIVKQAHTPHPRMTRPAHACACSCRGRITGLQNP